MCELPDKEIPGYDATASPNAAYTLITIIALLPVIQSIVDIFDMNSLDLKIGLPLNLTYTRMIHFACKGWSNENLQGDQGDQDGEVRRTVRGHLRVHATAVRAGWCGGGRAGPA